MASYLAMALNDPVSKLSDALLIQQIALSETIKENDQRNVKKFLTTYSPKEDPDECILISSLEKAIKYNRLGIIDLLINKGACEKALLNGYEQNALHIAALHRNKEMILRILQSNADWNAVDVRGANVLHLVLIGAKCISSTMDSYQLIYNSSITSTDEQRIIIDILRIFLNMGLDVNGCTRYSESPLELAIKNGMIDVAKFLIQSGADPNVCDRHGDGVLHMLIRYVVKQNKESLKLTTSQVCAEGRIINFVKWMQSKGMMINRPNAEQVTPLELAMNLRLETMVQIIMGTIDINCVNARGQSILHVLLAKYYYSRIDSDDYDEHTTIVNLIRNLLNYGADVNVVDNNGNTPLHIVAKQKDNQLIELMLKYFTNVKAQSHYGETVLHIFISNSVTNGNYERFYERYVNTLLSRGAYVDKANGKGMTPVQLAVQQKHAEIVEILAKNGADLRVETKDGDDLFQLLLRSAVEVNEPTAYRRIIGVLLNNGFDLEKPDNNGHTLLHLATMWGNPQLINALLEMGADVNYRDLSLRRLTPLHIAIQSRPMSVIETLLKFSANLDTRTKDGESPLGMAVKRNDLAITKKLVEAGANVNVISQDSNRLLILAVKSMNSEMIKFLLNHGADVNLCDESVKLTPLHVAADTNQIDLVDLLIKSGANVNARNALEETPLHLAARHNNSMVESLVKGGASIYLLDNKNRLPLHRTVERNNIVGLYYLLESGQDINALGYIQFRMISLLDDENHTYVNQKAIIIQHLTRLHVIGLLVPRLDDKNYVHKPDHRFYKQCLDEVTKLKKRYIHDQISVYDFIHMTPKSQQIYAKTVKFEFYADLLNYNSLVEMKVREARERKELLELAASAWYETTNIRLPDLCLGIILNYVKNHTLKFLIQSAEDRT